MRSESLRTIKTKSGLGLIEIVITIAIISIGLASLYAVLHRGLNHMRIVSEKNYAIVATMSELELIKSMSRVEPLQEYEGPFMGDIDLSALNEAKGFVKIEDYKDSDDLKRVTANITWVVAGKSNHVSLSTLVKIQ